MWRKLLFLASVVLVLGLAGGVQAQTLEVPPDHTVTGSETYHEMHVREGGTVTVPSGASLTIEIQGIGGEYGKHCNVDGGTLVVRGDFLCYQGEGRMNTQVEADAHSTILMEGNSYAVTGRFLLGDDPVGSTAVYVRTGTMTIGNLAGGYMTLRGERGVRVYIGGGELIVYNTSTEGDGDPCNWVAQGWLLPDAGYESVNIEDNYGGITNCVRITATVGAPIAMPPTTPTDGATNVCPDAVVLSWIPGRETQDPNGHNVYFGTNYDDVYEANVAEPCGVLVSYRQDSNTYPEAGSLSLELNKTYYWRVDEVNDNNSSSPWKGHVWSFTTEGTDLSNPFPGNGWKGIAPGSLTLTWEGPCLADAYKVYLGEDLPSSIVLFEDDFEKGLFDANWSADPAWTVWDAGGDPSYSPHDHNLATTSGSGNLEMAVGVDASDACSVRVEFDFRKTEEITDGVIKLEYYGSGGWTEVADLNSNPAGANDVWLHYNDDVNVNDPYLIDGFKLRFVSTISSGTVYIDNVKITNTWPAAGQWFNGVENDTSHTVVVDPNTRYYWRVDTIVDGNEYKGDTWDFTTSMIGGVVFHLDLEGTAGNVLPSSITYGPTNITFNKYTSDGNEVRYSSDNGYGLSGYTSADFDWGSGLYRDDLGGPTDLDPLRLDGYQYTIELWIKPVMPPDNQIDEARLIGRDNSWEIVLNDIGPNYDDGFELLWYHGQEGISRDNISQLMKLAEYGETEWMHIAAVHNLLAFRKQMLYLNGEVIQTEGDYLFNPSDNNEPVGIACDWDKSGTIDMDDAYVGKIDEVRVLDIALTPDQFLLVPGPEWASYPNPSHGAIDIDPCDANIVLSWIPGTKAETHKVYFSTDFEDINSSNADALVANLPVETNSWPAGPDGLTPHLDFGNVYYWRVTEVNGLDTWPGVIWDFTTKYELIDPDMLLWYQFDDSGEKVIDTSGYGMHGNLEMDEIPLFPWGTGKFGGCLRLDDDKSVSVPLDVLHTIDDQISISIWLYGQSVTGDNIVLQAGNEETNCVEIQVPDYSRDVYWRAGNDVNDVLTWEAVNVRALEDNWHHFVFIKDEADDKMSIYFDGELKWWKEDTSVSLTDLRDKPFRIGAEVVEDNDYVGWMDDLRVYKKALTDVNVLELFRGGDVDVAWAPDPYDGQPDAPYDANLVWKPGEHVNDVNGHQVFFGTGEQQVANMTDPCATKDLGDEDYEPGSLELDTYYYWRIDEVNGPCTWPGPIWTFKTARYITVDDFEAYDKTTNQIKDTWRDYWYQAMNPPYTATGGLLDLGVHPYNIVYPAAGGTQSMLYQYKNILWGTPGHDDAYAAVCYSEVSLPMPAELQDWTAGGVRVLRLYFYGGADNDTNDTEQMYVGLKDGSNPSKYAEVRYGKYDPDNEDMNDFRVEEWHRWDIGLPHFNDPCYASIVNDVDLSNIAELYIGFGDKGNPVCGGEGVVIFDDIRLHMPVCVPQYGPAADFSGNCIVDMADVGMMADAWLRHDVNYGPGQIQEPNDANLVGWWRLDGDACDSSIYDHNSSIEGSFSWVTGHNDVNVDDLAVQFTGGGGRVLVEDANELRPEHQVSASAWVYSSQRHDYGARVVVKGKDGEETYALEVDDDDHHTLFRVKDANEDKRYTAEAEDYIPTQEWLHMAGTYDGNTAKLYVNGELWASVNDEDPNKLELSQDTNGLAIGNRPEDDNRAFKGTIDEVRVYDYALSEAEVRWLASDGTGYVPLTSLYNLYDKEVPGKQAINFKDFAMLLEDWLVEILYP